MVFNIEKNLKMMKQPELGKKVLALRQRKGLTQSELAEVSNLSLRTIQRIESGEVTPRNYTIKVVFESLDYQSTTNNSSLLQNGFHQFLNKVIELLNLKTNTMQTLSVLSLVIIISVFGIFLKVENANAQKINGWFLAGSSPKSYSINLDNKVFKTNNSSAVLQSKQNNIDGFGTLMQSCSADGFLGKRVKMSGYIKTEDVENWAGMWLRIDAKNSKKSLGFDNMNDRPITGNTNWKKYEIILDVPQESSTLSYGVLLSGTGKVWFDNVQLEIVDTSTETTKYSLTFKKPMNLDFNN